MNLEVVDFSLSVLLTLFALATLAGAVDSIAGGGGLITVPVLLWAGLSPAQAIATNKLQSSFGSVTATWNFHRKGHLQLRPMAMAVALTFIGSASGSLAIQAMDPAFLSKFIPFLLIGIAAYFLLQPNLGSVDRHERLPKWAFCLLIALPIGFYDGFFGPGTGSFFGLAFVSLMGFNLVKATAHAKLLNATSNVAALLFFSYGGNLLWLPGIVMGGGALLGAWIGSNLAIRHGQRMIRPIVVAVCLAITLKLLLAD